MARFNFTHTCIVCSYLILCLQLYILIFITSANRRASIQSQGPMREVHSRGQNRTPAPVCVQIQTREDVAVLHTDRLETNAPAYEILLRSTYLLLTNYKRDLSKIKKIKKNIDSSFLIVEKHVGNYVHI